MANHHPRRLTNYSAALRWPYAPHQNLSQYEKGTGEEWGGKGVGWGGVGGFINTIESAEPPRPTACTQRALLSAAPP